MKRFHINALCPIFIIVLVLLAIYTCNVRLFSVALNISTTNKFVYPTIHPHCTQKCHPLSICHLNNIVFTYQLCILFAVKILFVWLAILLLKAGDVKPNPGPISSPNSSLSSNPSVSFNESITGSGHLSFIHYNVQSIFNKLDILRAEFAELDILAFSESWLNPSIQNSDLSFDSFSQPERKDRDDSHGGVILYVRDSIPYKRRHDLEPTGIECIWVELLLKHKHVLFGLFYRPPNSDADHFAKNKKFDPLSC